MASPPDPPIGSDAPPNEPSMSAPQENMISQDVTPTPEEITLVIDRLKEKVAFDRRDYIKKRMEENRKQLSGIVTNLQRLCMERSGTNDSVNLLVKRQNDSQCNKSGGYSSNGDNYNSQDDGHPLPVLQGSNVSIRNAVHPIKLPVVIRLPPYTTWTFLDRNQRMTEDQSVLGRRRIYYDQNGGEALICSDSEEELPEDEGDKRDFTEAEDYIISSTVKELDRSDPVLERLGECLSRSSLREVKARSEILFPEEKGLNNKNDDAQTANDCLDKDLETALDSFDNLFCRRCLVFDCRLHGCSQDLIFPAEKQPPPRNLINENEPCGPHCYQMALKNRDTEETTIPLSNGTGAQLPLRKLSRRKKPCDIESASSNAKVMSESSDSDSPPQQDNTSTERLSSPKGSKRNRKQMQKRQKKASDSDSVTSGGPSSNDMILRSNSSKDTNSKHAKLENGKKSSRNKSSSHGPVDKTDTHPCATKCNHASRKEGSVAESTSGNGLADDVVWRRLEKDLFAKGVEIFGRNSCLIAKNILSDLKTCSEVFRYMTSSDNRLPSQAGDGANADGYSKFDASGMATNDVRRRSGYLRRRGKVRRLKYTWKSAAYHSIRKRITEKKDQPCRQYNPCGCETACSKQCTCLLNGTCCEKYCGCPKTCKNRFRGCHCAKSQCRSRQCPCFAADRECDPDVCRNCWISCGDGTFGNPSQRGDNYECRNMKLLLKQQQRVLLGRSDVSGWGAFLKNNVAKHEYLGEYTGELISHREADKRGKIYDRENSSFLFNLNDQFVLDAYRKGDKLKFANHSPEPNCYAKVMMVAGDHRVGIFAKERIMAGEELFYDYRYEPDRAPIWARKPEVPGSKKEEAGPSSGRAKKLA